MNVERGPWTKQKERALALVSEGRLTTEEICEKLKISRNCLWKWKKTGEWKEREALVLKDTQEALTGIGIRVRDTRLKYLQERHDKLMRVIKARGEQYAGFCPGGETGLLAQDLTKNGVVYKIDSAALRELREIEKQAAIEMGEWSEKREVKLDIHDLRNMSDEELEAIASGDYIEGELVQ